MSRIPGLIPWVWGTNGCFSGNGSILSVMISMTFGFNLVPAFSGTIYRGAFCALHAEVSSGASV